MKRLFGQRAVFPGHDRSPPPLQVTPPQAECPMGLRTRGNHTPGRTGVKETLSLPSQEARTFEEKGGGKVWELTKET